MSEPAKVRRRVEAWPGMVLGLLFLLGGVYLVVALQPVIGASGGLNPAHTGMAEVRSCKSSGLHLGMVDTCRASIRWDDGFPGRDDYNITAARPISGSVRVEYFRVGRGLNNAEILPVDRPQFASKGTYVFLAFVTAILLAGVGGGLGYLFARLLPEPPVPVKKFRRGVERRENPGFNGPRRRKRR